MSRKLNPQMSESAANRIRQSVLGRDGAAGAGAGEGAGGGVVPELSGCGTVGVEGALMTLTMTVGNT